MHKNNFLKYIEFEKRYSKHTLISYNTDLTQFLNFLHDEYEIFDVSEVSHQIIRSWISSMLDSGISSRSVNRKITTLKSFYKYLMQEDVVTENPTQKIISPKNAKKLPVFVEKSKMDELLSEIEFPDTFDGERDKLIIDVFYMTGMRLSELLGIRKKDIDFSLKDGFGNLKKIKAYSKPLLVIHANLDHIIPLEQGQLVYDSVLSENKKIFIVENADHNNIIYRIKEDYFKLIRGFIDSI